MYHTESKEEIKDNHINGYRKNTTKFNSSSWYKLSANRNRTPSTQQSISSTNIIFSNERVNAFSLKSVTRQRYSLSSLLSNLTLEVLARAIKQEKEMEKKRIKFYSQTCLSL